MKKTNFFRRASYLMVLLLMTSSFALTAQTYRNIKG